MTGSGAFEVLDISLVLGAGEAGAVLWLTADSRQGSVRAVPVAVPDFKPLVGDGEPVGWCSLAPRSDYPYLRQTTWRGRSEDRDDPGIWAVTCLVTRAGHRRQGVSRALVAATIDLPRQHGARAVEAYPMKPAPGKDVPWGELHVGALSSFLAAGYRIVHTPSLRRAVVRHEF